MRDVVGALDGKSASPAGDELGAGTVDETSSTDCATGETVGEVVVEEIILTDGLVVGALLEQTSSILVDDTLLTLRSLHATLVVALPVFSILA